MSRPAPRTPNRQRTLRPDFWRDGATGRLHGAERDLYLGLATLTDDEGWTLYRPETIAALLYPFEPVNEREVALVEISNVLIGAELLIVFDCGCAYLPRVKEDLGFKGGTHSSTVRDYHASEHFDPDDVRTSTDKSLSFVASSSSSFVGKSVGERQRPSRAPARGGEAGVDKSTAPKKDGHAPVILSEGEVAALADHPEDVLYEPTR